MDEYSGSAPRESHFPGRRHPGSGGGVQRHPVAQVTPWLLLAPMGAVVLGMLYWGDHPGPRLWIGGAMVLGGVLIIAMRALQKLRALPVPEEI